MHRCPPFSSSGAGPSREWRARAFRRCGSKRAAWAATAYTRCWPTTGRGSRASAAGAPPTRSTSAPTSTPRRRRWRSSPPPADARSRGTTRGCATRWRTTWAGRSACGATPAGCSASSAQCSSAGGRTTRARCAPTCGSTRARASTSTAACSSSGAACACACSASAGAAACTSAWSAPAGFKFPAHPDDNDSADRPFLEEEVLRIDETSKTLVAPQAGGLVTEAAPDRDELLTLISASWEAFVAELGLPHLRLAGREPADGADLLAFDEAEGRAVLLHVTGETVEWQVSRALAAAAEVASWDAAQLAAAGEALEAVVPGDSPRLVLLAGGYDPRALKTVDWLSRRHGVEVSAFSISVLRFGNERLLNVTREPRDAQAADPAAEVSWMLGVGAPAAAPATPAAAPVAASVPPPAA